MRQERMKWIELTHILRRNRQEVRKEEKDVREDHVDDCNDIDKVSPFT